MSIVLVAGLGNPGRQYEHTRHNLGWWVLDRLAAKHRLSWKRDLSLQGDLARWSAPGAPVRWLLKPLTYMNDSGVAVAALARYHKLGPAEVAVVHDDVGLDVGRLKVSATGSAGGHNGIANVLEQLGDGFARFRIGIGPKEPAEMDLKDFVLTRFSTEQLVIIDRKLDQYVQGLELLLECGVDQAMNQLNRKEEPS
jgi:PTH1 family peptidyl-tRNA hydrolase